MSTKSLSATEVKTHFERALHQIDKTDLDKKWLADGHSRWKSDLKAYR